MLHRPTTMPLVALLTVVLGLGTAVAADIQAENRELELDHRKLVADRKMLEKERSASEDRRLKSQREFNACLVKNSILYLDDRIDEVDDGRLKLEEEHKRLQSLRAKLERERTGLDRLRQQIEATYRGFGRQYETDFRKYIASFRSSYIEPMQQQHKGVRQYLAGMNSYIDYVDDTTTICRQKPSTRLVVGSTRNTIDAIRNATEGIRKWLTGE